MSKQEKPKRETNPTLFTKRFQQLFEKDESQEHFAKRVGLTRNTIAAYYNGYISWPTTEALRKICTSCKVSADWLIGLSEVRTHDENIQSACTTLGISEDVAQFFLLFSNSHFEMPEKMFSPNTFSQWEHIFANYDLFLKSDFSNGPSHQITKVEDGVLMLISTGRKAVNYLLDQMADQFRTIVFGSHKQIVDPNEEIKNGKS